MKVECIQKQEAEVTAAIDHQLCHIVVCTVAINHGNNIARNQSNKK